MWRCVSILALPVCALLAPQVQAQQSAGTRYPRVYGATGRPYGPTQAHYQYQRRYGRTWHGRGGAAVRYPDPVRGYYPRHAYGWGLPVGLLSYGYACQPWLAPNFSGNVTSPLVHTRYPDPLLPSPDVYNNDALRDAWLENQSQPDAGRFPKIAPQVATPSTPEATMRSVRAERRGDEWFRQQQYSQAHERYEHAISLAEDRPEPWFRKAFALAALGHFYPAARTIQRGLEVDPDWPSKGESLDSLFGPDNVLAKTALLHRVSSWVRADVRDPERLFLMGVLLHFDNQRDKSPVFFDAALRLAGHGDHLMAFLQSVPLDPQIQEPDGPAPGGTGVPALPPVPREPAAPTSPPADSGIQLPVPPIPSEIPAGDDAGLDGPLPGLPDAVNSGPALLAPGL